MAGSIGKTGWFRCASSPPPCFRVFLGLNMRIIALLGMLLLFGCGHECHDDRLWLTLYAAGYRDR